MQETNPTEIICIQQNAETPEFKLLLINDCGFQVLKQLHVHCQILFKLKDNIFMQIKL